MKQYIETMERLMWQILNGLRRSTNQKFFITFLAPDVSSGDSVLAKQPGQSERMVSLVKDTLYKTVGKSKLEQNKNRRSSYRYRDNRPTTDHWRT